MNNKGIILVLDCGATNVRTMAVDETGNLITGASKPNNTKPDPFYPEYRIWDIDEIWAKLVVTTREVISKIEQKQILGITVTTFGVDIAPVDEKGNLTYPVISWACQRTNPIMENIDKYIDMQKLYELNGVNKFSFNTINKLIWFKENQKKVLEDTKHFVFISSLLLYKLSGSFVTERTMAGTSMLTELKSQEFSHDILESIGYDIDIFPKMAEAGEVIGTICESAHNELNIPIGVPVIAAGHDTQFSMFGAGAGINQPVLTSGTWEILMVRTPNVRPNSNMYRAGVTTELDCIQNISTPGLQWLGSGILEWIKKTFYIQEILKMPSDNVYETMIQDAMQINQSTLNMDPDFLNNNGIISGIGLNTKRGEIYLAAIKALVKKTKSSLDIVEKNCGFKAREIICVGGGSKNSLWNKERARALGIPVMITKQTETTVLGAALFALYGIGLYKSPDEAREQIDYEFRTVF